MSDQPGPTTRNTGNDTDSSWSIEHYGFESEAAPGPPPGPPREQLQEQTVLTSPPPHLPRGGRSRTRMLLASGALVLGLIGGGAGFTAAQASTGGGDGHATAVHLVDDHRGDPGGHGGRR